MRMRPNARLEANGRLMIRCGSGKKDPGSVEHLSRTLRSLTPCSLAGLDPHSIFDRFFVRE